MRFPDGFLWGAATAAYQIEGAAREDGRGESIWDRFSRTPGRIQGGDTGDVACDHYHRWAEDVDLMASLGLGAYRFSIAWPRVQPTGAGPVNGRGLDFYRRLVDRLRDRGITPVATLYHWDLPQALQERGGWVDRDTAARFAEYAAILFDALGPAVPMWITHNEPWCASILGHYRGVHAPGLTDLRLALVAAHHLLLSHGRAVVECRRRGAGAIGIAPNLLPTWPATDAEADRAAARLSDGYTNRWFLDPVLRGSYPADLAAHYERRVGPLDFVRPGDLDLIGEPTDFLGVNYYRRRIVEAAPEDPLGWRVQEQQPGVPTTAVGSEIVPHCLTELLVRLRDDYGNVPIYITENGAAFADQVGPDGAVHDPERVAFLERHVAAAHRAIELGCDLRGYFAWSFMDNFEWAFGYAQRFGIVHVDHATQRRTPKDSARMWSALARTNRLEPTGAALPAASGPAGPARMTDDEGG